MPCIGGTSVPRAMEPLLSAAATVLVVQAAVGVLYQAATVAADTAAQALARWGDVLQRRVDAQIDAEAALGEWHMAAAEVVGLNAVIRVLRVRAAKQGVAVDLPEPLALDGMSLPRIVEWMVAAREPVEAARTALAEATAAGEWARLVQSLPATVSQRPGMAEALSRYQQMLSKKAVSDSGAEVERVLRRLDADVDAADREAVLRVAAFATAQTDPVDAQAYLDALRRKIDREVNPRVANRRLAAQWLQALQHPVVAATPTAEGDPPTSVVIGHLTAVVDGAAELTDPLREQAAQALAWAATVARLHYLRDLLAQGLTASGYRIVENVAAQGIAGVRVTRAGWQAEHTAQVWVDSDWGCHSRLLQETGDGGDDMRLRGHGRATELAGHLATIVHDMSHDGIGGLSAHTHQVQRQHGEAGAGAETATVSRPAPAVRQRSS